MQEAVTPQVVESLVQKGFVTIDSAFAAEHAGADPTSIQMVLVRCRGLHHPRHGPANSWQHDAQIASFVRRTLQCYSPIQLWYC